MFYSLWPNLMNYYFYDCIKNTKEMEYRKYKRFIFVYVCILYLIISFSNYIYTKDKFN